jgi:hypothetical protein
MHCIACVAVAVAAFAFAAVSVPLCVCRGFAAYPVFASSSTILVSVTLPPDAGLYLLSAGLDKALVLWDVHEQECLVKAELPGLATGLAWHPTRNEVAVITEDGARVQGYC